MARRRDSRSPSPVGSPYSASRRDRRDDPRDRNRKRDDRRGDGWRGDDRRIDRRRGDDKRSYRPRSRERYDYDSRKPRRDRSRDDRRRSRDRDGDRDRDRDRDLDRDRDRDREGDRRRREDDSRNGDRKHDDKDRDGKKAAQTDEEKKAERLAKLEAWKQKQKEKKEQQQTSATSSATATRNLLDEIDKKAAGTPSGVASPRTPSESGSVASPAPYQGKFDPKAIAKKADKSSIGSSKLGLDVTLPEVAIPKANQTAVPRKPTATGKLAKAPTGKVSGFGLAKTTEAQAAAKKGFDLGEDEEGKRKLEKLPTPPLENGVVQDEAADAISQGDDGDEDDDDDDIDMQDGTEEEAAAAARAAAEKREERLQAQNLAYNAELQDSAADETSAQNADTEMVDTDVVAVAPAEEEDANEDDEDPLDAYMAELGESATSTKPHSKNTRSQVPEPQVMFGDDDDVLPSENDEEKGTDDFLAITNKKKKKDIPAIDHAKVQYEPFDKSFYLEPSELQALTDDEVTNLRFELDDIKVMGEDPPKPAVRWSQCGLLKRTHDVVESVLKFEKPSSIQSQAIPSIMSGRDVMGVAKTGSGKTVAFLLPMFRHIMAQRPLRNLEGPIAIIMTPTRELATQIHRDCKPFLKALQLRATCAYGGAPIKDQIAELKRGAEIVVCTPGRMIDLLAANAGRVTNLKRVTYTVLDEADRMFDMGFEPQVMKILANIRPDRQTVLFSATFPRQMEALARKTLTKPVIIVVGGRSVVAKEITQVVEVRPEESKFIRLLELLGKQYEDDDDSRTLIFVDRQESADSLLGDLMRKGYPCMSIHGGKDQTDRDSTISDFKNGIVPILVATSVAARGLDVKQLKLVVNYDAPNHLEDYVHRAGRTGRAGNTGTAVTFLTPEQGRYAVEVAKAVRQSGQPVPEDVQKLAEEHIEKVKSGQEKAGKGGFGGKGLERLDQERDAARNRERKSYKTGDDDAEDDNEDKDNKRVDELIAKAIAGNKPATPEVKEQIPGVPKGIDLDGKVTVHKTEKVTSTSKNPLDKVNAAVANINNRIRKPGAIHEGVPIDNKGPDAGAFHSTLEINDFPQKARWAVTNRTNVAKILEATGTSITTKGSFYGTGKEPGAGENPKLYILVEGDTEVVVTNAMQELMRLLKEGTIAAADSDARAPASGRYNVLG